VKHVVLLRGINLGAHRRVAMPELRELLSDAGFEDVRTYVQSGNVVLESKLSSAKVAERCRELISKRFGFEVPVVVRTRTELAKVVSRDPLGDVAENPKRYQVSFLSERLDPKVVERLNELAVESEGFVVDGRELYAWHPDGVARSKLWNEIAGPRLGVSATARNWTTVMTLLEMAQN
jgi:uncharacterized protein (DUF1697 family)